MKRTNRAPFYRVSVNYTVTYDPNSEVPGISIFYPEGHTDLVVDGHHWDDYYAKTEGEAIRMAKDAIVVWVSGGRYQHGTIKIHSISAHPAHR